MCRCSYVRYTCGGAVFVYASSLGCGNIRMYSQYPCGKWRLFVSNVRAKGSRLSGRTRTCPNNSGPTPWLGSVAFVSRRSESLLARGLNEKILSPQQPDKVFFIIHFHSSCKNKPARVLRNNRFATQMLTKLLFRWSAHCCWCFAT